jgi:predicted Rdx family selenoprotein
MAPVLLIVARNEPRLFAYVESSFAGVKSVQVLVDRRNGGHGSPDGRGPDRRVRDVSQSLRDLGWAVVKS